MIANVRQPAWGADLLYLFLVLRGRLARNKNLDPKFDSKAWIGLDFIDDLVVAGDEILQDRPTAFHHEFAHLIEIERYKLLDLEDVDAISKANIFSQRFRDRETSLPRDEDWAMPIIEIVAAALDRRFAGRCRNVDRHVADEEVAFAAGLLVRGREAVVLEFP